MADRQIVMVGFLTQNCSNYLASWRHSESAGDFMSPAYYARIARALEDGKFHLGFFDDRLAMPDIYGADHADPFATVWGRQNGSGADLATMAMGTKCLGLAATCSTTYYGPFHIARTFMTLDHMTATAPVGMW